MALTVVYCIYIILPLVSLLLLYLTKINKTHVFLGEWFLGAFTLTVLGLYFYYEPTSKYSGYDMHFVSAVILDCFRLAIYYGIIILIYSFIGHVFNRYVLDH